MSRNPVSLVQTVLVNKSAIYQIYHSVLPSYRDSNIGHYLIATMNETKISVQRFEATAGAFFLQVLDITMKVYLIAQLKDNIYLY